jgi:hypothetical protein
LRERFPRAERRWFGRPLRWVLVGVLACATLAVGQQGGYSNPATWLFEKLRGAYEAFTFGFKAFDTSAVMVRMRQSQPRVYVDGQLQPPPDIWRGADVQIHVPGEGEYFVMLVDIGKGFVQAGRMHGNFLEFQAGSRHVRIECNRQLVSADRPVYVWRQQ